MGLSANGNFFRIIKRSETWAADVRDVASELVAFVEKEFGENIKLNKKATRGLFLILVAFVTLFSMISGNFGLLLLFTFLFLFFFNICVYFF